MSDRDETTPQQRQHVARKLRLWAHRHRKDTWEHSSLDLELMAKTGGCTPSDVADALVGLIDPTTTVHDDSGRMVCDSCGERVETERVEVPTYCPMCGRRITNREEA